MRFKLTVIALGLALAFHGPAFAQDDRAGHHPVAVLKAALGLTEDQLAQLHELIQERNTAVGENAGQIAMAKDEMEEETGSDSPDPQLVGELFLEIFTLKQENAGRQQDFNEAFREMLTEEQLRRLAQIKRTSLLNRAADALNQLNLR